MLWDKVAFSSCLPSHGGVHLWGPLISSTIVDKYLLSSCDKNPMTESGNTNIRKLFVSRDKPSWVAAEVLDSSPNTRVALYGEAASPDTPHFSCGLEVPTSLPVQSLVHF